MEMEVTLGGKLAVMLAQKMVRMTAHMLELETVMEWGVVLELGWVLEMGAALESELGSKLEQELVGEKELVWEWVMVKESALLREEQSATVWVEGMALVKEVMLGEGLAIELEQGLGFDSELVLEQVWVWVMGWGLGLKLVMRLEEEWVLGWVLVLGQTEQE